MTLVAVVCGGAAFYRQRYWARKHADELYADWQHAKNDIHLGRNWCLAECAVPFSDHAAACRRYADEAFRIIEAVNNPRLPSPFAEQMDRFKQEAENWLAAGTATGEPEKLSYSTH